MRSYREIWKEQGYLLLSQTFEQGRIAKLSEIIESSFAQWRQDSREEAEPFGFSWGPKAWIMLHLNHPKFYRRHREWLPYFLDVLADPFVLNVLQDVFGAPPILQQTNLYMEPPGESWNGIWHRDAQFYAAGDEGKEMRMVADEADPPRELHMHIPLVPTAASEVVPGSHTRWDTPEEHRIRREDPYTDAMPGALSLPMAPGDLGFFHINSIHRGLYHTDVPRRTISVTYTHPDYPRPATAEWMKEWRGYASTYQPWFLQPGYLDGVSEESRVFYQRYIDQYRDSWKPEFLEPLNPERQAYFRDLELSRL